MIADVRDAELARRPSVKINIYKPDEYLVRKEREKELKERKEW